MRNTNTTTKTGVFDNGKQFVCVVFFLRRMLPVFLNFPFVIASLVFPYVYMMTIWWRSRSFDVTCTKTNLGSKRIMWSKPSIVILQYEVFYWNILNEYYLVYYNSESCQNPVHYNSDILYTYKWQNITGNECKVYTFVIMA
jgi:hypothetical protein